MHESKTCVTTVVGVLALALTAGSCVSGGSGDDAGQLEPTRASVARFETPGCESGGQLPEVVRIGIASSVIHSSNGIKRDNPMLPVADYLTRKVGRIVEVVPMEDYALLTQGIIAGSLHGAIIPPIEYLNAKKQIPCLRLAATTVYGTSTSYSTNIVVRRDSNILATSDLRGRRIAFVSRNSASGFIYAVKFLNEQGLFYGKDYEPVFVGSHLEVIHSVQQGIVDAGATFAPTIAIAATAGQDVSNISMLAVSGQIPAEPLVISPGLDSVLARRIADAFIGLNTNSAEGRRALADQDLITAWVATDESYYDAVRQVSDEVGRLTGSEVAP